MWFDLETWILTGGGDEPVLGGGAMGTTTSPSPWWTRGGYYVPPGAGWGRLDARLTAAVHGGLRQGQDVGGVLGRLRTLGKQMGAARDRLPRVMALLGMLDGRKKPVR